MDWTDEDQDGDRWWAFINLEINLKVTKNAGDFLISYEDILALQE
jgi:hypothetical protein